MGSDRTREHSAADLRSQQLDKTFLVGNGHTSAWSCKLSVTAFALIMGSLASTHDHAGAVPMRRDMPQPRRQAHRVRKRP